MAFGTPVFATGSFSATRTLSVNLGSAADRGLLVLVFNEGTITPGGTSVSSVALDPEGANLAMTAGTELSGSSAIGYGGKLRAFWISGASVPTGVKNVTVTCANANGKPHVWALPLSGVTAVGGEQVTTATTTNAPYSAAVTSAAGREIVSFLAAATPPDGYAATPTAPTTMVKRVLQADSPILGGAILTRPGADTATVAGTWGGTGLVWSMLSWSLTVPVTIFAFTNGPVPAQSGTVGATSTALSLAGYFTGGTTPYAYALASGSLPPGLTLNASTGQITGTPTAAGSYTAVVRATDAAAATADTNSIAWTVSTPPAQNVTLTGPAGGQVGAQSAAFTVGADGLITGSITVTPGDGGAGGSFAPASVTISSGTPTATFTYTPSSAGTKSISVTNSGTLANPAPLSYAASSVIGTITVTDIRNGSGGLLTSTQLPNVVVLNRGTRALLLALTAQTTTAAGALTISSGALPIGTACMVVAFSSDGTAAGAWPATVA